MATFAKVFDHVVNVRRDVLVLRMLDGLVDASDVPRDLRAD